MTPVGSRSRTGRHGRAPSLWRGARPAVVPLVGWFVAITAVGLALGAILVGVHGDGGSLTSFDARVNRWFGHHHVAWGVSASQLAADAASVGGLAVITVALGLVLWWVGWRVRAFVPLVAFLGAELIVFVVKEVIVRHRPPTASGIHRYPWVHGYAETDWSFPSGHSTATAAVVIALALLAVMSGARWWPWFVAVVVACAVGLSRLVLGVHWFSDVLVGLCLGTAWGGAVATLLREPTEGPPGGGHPVPEGRGARSWPDGDDPGG